MVISQAAMLNTPRAYGGMVTAPHHLASQAGAAVLRQGGNAAEAMLAMAAAIAVVYPAHELHRRRFLLACGCARR
jgi:gamma-glutamyltranspeptidase